MTKTGGRMGGSSFSKKNTSDNSGNKSNANPDISKKVNDLPLPTPKQYRKPTRTD